MEEQGIDSGEIVESCPGNVFDTKEVASGAALESVLGGVTGSQ